MWQLHYTSTPPFIQVCKLLSCRNINQITSTCIQTSFNKPLTETSLAFYTFAKWDMFDLFSLHQFYIRHMIVMFSPSVSLSWLVSVKYLVFHNISFLVFQNIPFLLIFHNIPFLLNILEPDSTPNRPIERLINTCIIEI